MAFIHISPQASLSMTGGPLGCPAAMMNASHDLVHSAAGIQAVRGYKREDFVGICGFSSLDWITADYANTYCGKSRYSSLTLMAHFKCALACIACCTYAR